MLTKKIRQTIIEEKERKEKLLIEQNLIESRLMAIIESKDNIEKLHLLPKEKREKIAIDLLKEFKFLGESDLVNEQLGDFLGKIFGNSLSGIIQTAVEPLVDSILGGLGLGGYFKKFLVSFLTSNPTKLIAALKSCEELTKLVVEALVEGLVMMIQEEKGLGGKGYDFLRNAIGGAIKDTKFAESLENQLQSFVCSVFGKFSDKAGEVYDKLKPLGQ
jgi:hypothetical protein